MGETRAIDLKETLQEWLPPIAFETPLQFDTSLQSEPGITAFQPPGKRIASYDLDSRTYEIWEGHLTDLAVQQVLKRLQIFIPFFIEGGTYLNLDDPEWSLQRWRIYFLYDHTPSVASSSQLSSYSIIGYCTSYRYYLFPSSHVKPIPGQPLRPTPHTKLSIPPPSLDIASLPSRIRISQFLILPPYQSLGHGSRFYTSLYDLFFNSQDIQEITIEDPNESFDDLRDYCDLARLRQSREFTALHIDTSVPIPPQAHRLPTARLLPLDRIDSLRHAYKIAPRQFARLVEMQLLSQIPRDHRQAGREHHERDEAIDADRAYERWRLLVKQRLARFNREQLSQLDRTERVGKLEEALSGVESDYERLLRGADGIAKKAQAGQGEDQSSLVKTAELEIRGVESKRKTEAGHDTEPPTKKAKHDD